MESSEEDNTKPLEIIPVKRKRTQSSKRLKIPKFVNPAKQVLPQSSTQKVVKPEDMFEPVQRGETKNLKIELKTVDKLLDSSNKEENPVSENTTDSGFGLMFPASKDLETIETNESTECVQREIITSEELANNRISTNGKNGSLFYRVELFCRNIFFTFTLQIKGYFLYLKIIILASHQIDCT